MLLRLNPVLTPRQMWWGWCIWIIGLLPLLYMTYCEAVIEHWLVV
jgi:hypothetical protein